MGCLQTYKCNACDYSALIGGGEQFGMVSVQWTISCHECTHLFDVCVSEDASNTPDNWIPESYSCPRDEAHHVALWSEGGACPKCSGSMALERDGELVMWD
jgi:hypothetical protein